MKNVLIIQEELIIALHLKKLLEENGYNVFTIFDGGENISLECKLNQPKIIICDIYLKGAKSGIQIMQEVQNNTYIPLIFLSGHSSAEVLKELLMVKHEAYIVKPFNDYQILATIKLIDQKYYSSGPSITLSEREKQVAFHITNGLTNAEIAEQINISLHTVRTHRKNIYKKLGVHNVCQMTKKIGEMSLIN